MGNRRHSDHSLLMSLEEEIDKGEESITGDRNPLDDDPLNSEVVTNPLGMEYGSEDSNSKGVASEVGESVSAVTASVNVLSAQMNEDEALLATVTCDDTPAEVGDNPLGDSDKLPEVSLTNGRGPSEELVTRSDDAEAEMTEEDLLTGPAHNLDDSQYKADYADPNLDDIFK